MSKPLRKMKDSRFILKNRNVTNLYEAVEVERIKATLQSIGDGIITTDMNRNILFSNEAAAELTGWTVLESSGKKLAEVFKIRNQGVNEDVDNFFCEVVEKKIKIGLKNNSVLVSKNKEERFISASIAPILDKNKNSIGVVVTFRDITRIKKSEETLRSLYQAVEQSGNTVIITDREGKIQYVNPKFCQTTGYKMIEVIGKRPSILKSGKQSDEIYKVLWDTILAGKHWTGELKNKRKNGELYWELASISPVKNTEGMITHFIATKEDITMMKKMEEDLRRNKEAAEAANKFKSEFLANMSHEIRTPLNGIKGMIDLTLLMELTDEQQENLKIANTCVHALMNVINDILDFSKIETGKMHIENLEFPIRSFLEKTLKPHYIKAKEKMLSMNVTVNEDVPYMLIGDSNRVGQVVNNLIGNAIKFTETGRIEIHVGVVKKISEEGIILKLSVSDTGIGIERDKMKLLFKSFSQVDGTITRKYGGTGLGLAISKKLAELMGGSISVESEKGIGSKFSFTGTFGYNDKLETEYEPNINNKQPPTGSKKKELKILLVEDNKMNQIVVESMLEMIGQTVENAENGKEAVDLVKRNVYDIILMDIQMPEMDGIEATKAIRADEEKTERHTPIIALTAYALQGDKERFLKAGMDGYISKPIEMKELFEVIEKCIQNDRKRNLPVLSEKKEFAGYKGGTRILSAREIEIFLETVPTYIESLEGAIDSVQYEKIERYAHFIKELSYEMDLDFIKNLAFKVVLAARKEKIEEIKIKFTELVKSISITKAKWTNMGK